MHWDAAAMMPPGGAAARSEQLATLRGIAHQLLAAPEIDDLVQQATGQPPGATAFKGHLRERYLA